MRYCTLQDWICVDAGGPDAVGFLRAQLTNDPPVQRGEFAMAASCDARGRVRAIFDVLRAGDDRCVLLAERETADSVLKALRTYVLRAKVELRVNDGWRAAGIAGDESALTAWSEQRRTADEEAHVQRVGTRLAYVVGPAEAVERTVVDLEEAPAQRIELEAIRLGLPRVREAAMLQYVPQMLNLDRLGAVSFTKGCYPGQEIVARLYHRGSVKRRMQRFRFEQDEAIALPAPGDAIVADREDASEGNARPDAAGEVIRAAADGSHGELLAVVQLDLLASPLRLGNGVGTTLRHEPLPYDD